MLLWMIVGRFGFISSFLGYLFLAFAITGFEKCGGMAINKHQFKQILVLAILTVPVAVLTDLFFSLMNSGLTFQESVSAFPRVIK